MEVNNNAVKSKISVDPSGGSMNFDRFQSAALGSDSFYSPNKHQTSLTEDCLRLSQPMMSPSPLSNFSLPEESSLSYTHWATQEDPYQLVDGALGSAKNRNSDANEFGSEADLYGLVSTILEETDQMDSYFADEKPSKVWSLNAKRENSEEFFQAELTKESIPLFLQNPNYPNTFGRGQRQSVNKESPQKTCQLSSGFDVNNQWLFPCCSSDTDTCSHQTPGLQRMSCLSSGGNGYLSKAGPSKHDYSTLVKEDRFCSASSHINGAAHTVCSPNKSNELFYDPYTDYSNLILVKPSRSRPFTVPEGTKSAYNIQVLGSEDNTQNSQMGQSRYEDYASVQHSLALSGKMAFDSEGLKLQKDLAGDFKDQKTSDSRVRMQQPPTNYGSSDFSGFNSTQAEYFQQPKAFSETFNPPTPFLDKHGMQKDNYAMTNAIQYAPHHSEITQYQNQVRQPRGNCAPGLSKMQQMQGGTSCLPVCGQGDGANLYSRANLSQIAFNLEGLKESGNGQLEFESCNNTDLAAKGRSPQRFEARLTSQMSNQRKRDTKQGVLQNPYFDFLGSAYGSLRNAAGSNADTSGKTQTSPFLPYMYPDVDPRQTHTVGFSPRHTFPPGNSVTLLDLCDLLPDKDFTPFNPYIQTMMSSPKLTKNHYGPMSQLHLYLEECYEQWRVLEKERKKTEIILVKSYPGKRISVGSSSPIPKMPPNPSRVDRLIVDQLREQAKVVTLLGKMERLRSFPLHANICSAVDRHLEAIYITQARRREEFVNTSNRQKQGTPYFREDRDILLLAAALKDMCGSTRKCRTALWSALQMTLPKTITGNPGKQAGAES